MVFHHSITRAYTLGWGWHCKLSLCLINWWLCNYTIYSSLCWNSCSCILCDSWCPCSGCCGPLCCSGADGCAGVVGTLPNTVATTIKASVLRHQGQRMVGDVGTWAEPCYCYWMVSVTIFFFTDINTYSKLGIQVSIYTNWEYISSVIE